MALPMQKSRSAIFLLKYPLYIKSRCWTLFGEIPIVFVEKNGFEGLDVIIDKMFGIFGHYLIGSKITTYTLTYTVLGSRKDFTEKQEKWIRL